MPIYDIILFDRQFVKPPSNDRARMTGVIVLYFFQSISAAFAAMKRRNNCMMNIPEVKLGIVAVSRDCFPIDLSQRRRHAVVEAFRKAGGEIVEIQTTVENEHDAAGALEELKQNGVNALVMYLGNFGPETPETLVAQHFDGPVMFVAAAEDTLFSSARQPHHSRERHIWLRVRVRGTVRHQLPRYVLVQGHDARCASRQSTAAHR